MYTNVVNGCMNPWACEKVASDLELGGCFRRVLRFPPLLTTG